MVPDRTFFIIGMVVTVLVFVKEYTELAVDLTTKYPRTLCVLYLFGAWILIYVCINMAMQLQHVAMTDGVLSLVRSSLILGSIYMGFGPLLIFAPERKM